MYADDSTIPISGGNISDIQTNVQEDAVTVTVFKYRNKKVIFHKWNVVIVQN
jgi:hypothetical protein